MISFALTFLPYNFSLALPSERKVEPSREIPANRPLFREYERISALITMSVAPSAVRPLGPAAAEASAPNFTLLDRSDRAPRGFMTSNTKSLAWPPNWKPNQLLLYKFVTSGTRSVSSSAYHRNSA